MISIKTNFIFLKFFSFFFYNTEGHNQQMDRPKVSGGESNFEYKNDYVGF